MAIGKIYWDAAPLISWITDENTRSAAQKAALEAVATDFEKGKCVIIMSSLYRVEVLPLEKDHKAKLDLFTKRQNFQEIAIIPPILDIANEIRAFYRKESKAMSSPDAIHLATAIYVKADVFHTFDGGRKRGLLDLNGDVAGHNLAIKEPFIELGLFGTPL